MNDVLSSLRKHLVSLCTALALLVCALPASALAGENEALELSPRSTQNEAAPAAELSPTAMRDKYMRDVEVGQRFKYRDRGLLKVAGATAILPVAVMAAYGFGKVAADPGQLRRQSEGLVYAPPGLTLALLGTTAAAGFTGSALLYWSGAKDFKRYRKLDRRWKMGASLTPKSSGLSLSGRF